MVDKKKKRKEAEKQETIRNSYGELNSILGLNSNGTTGAQLSQDTTLYYNLRWNFVSNNRQLLAQSYVEHGLVQTLVDQPVEDAFRAGFEIKTGNLEPDEIERLQMYCEKSGLVRALMQGTKWARLFGGGGVLIITEQDPSKPLDVEELNEESVIEYRGVDMWELYQTEFTAQGSLDLNEEVEYYTYYGVRVHNSRVLRIEGKEAPSLVRPRLRGWGMSEMERLVRSINQYFKNQDVVFELLDEAKVDVYRIKDLNSTLFGKNGSTAVAERVAIANAQKNYNNAVMMDVKDEYEQKQITFAGLAEMLVQIRQGVAGDLKMPVTKLFGISSAGFSSGEDEIENYNGMIEGEVRAKTKFLLVTLLEVACQHLFGIIPDDLKVEFAPLRMLNAKEEEDVKNSQFNRTVSAYTSGLIDDEETKDAINKDSLLPVEIDTKKPADEPIGLVEPVKNPANFTVKETAGTN